MESEYDPEHEALAAMKLAAEADGTERQRWINAALAWIELTRLRVPIDRTQLRRWSLFLRQLMAEPAEETVVGPVLVVLLPTGLNRDERAALCGPANLISTQGICDRYDCASYAAAIGARPAQGLTSRVGHAAAIEVAAWSREMLEEMVRWDAADQISPFPLLERIAAKNRYPFPCWENGLVDYWDDEPAAHAAASVQHGYIDHIRRRVWSAQASILLPFTQRILRSLISRYQHVLARKVSPEKPYIRKIHDHVKTIEDFWKLEFYDLRSSRRTCSVRMKPVC